MASAELLTPQQAAAALGVSTNYLAKLRVSGRGPAFERLTPRVIRYSTADLDDWRQSRRRTSTSDQGAAV
jgi:predicted DNA-binding transcriptional regulator AlpA